MSKTAFVRPPLATALAAWRECLASHHLPDTPLWVFAENLCLEPSGAKPGHFRTRFQTQFTPPPEDALDIAYAEFGGTNARMVFHRLGSCPRGSVCLLLCDPWFETKSEREGFVRHDEWGISFYPGQAGDIEEVTNLARWVRRVKRARHVHDFDFSLSLATLDEIKTHGRALHPYERFADTLLNRMRQATK